jgi:hypothetical protein
VGGNEAADKLARRGASAVGLHTSRYVSIAHLRRRIKELAMEEWNLAWRLARRGRSYSKLPQQLTTKVKPHLNFENRMVVSTLIQLRMGHGYFKSYLIRLSSYDSEHCHCGARSQSPQHLLLECPCYTDPRRDMRRAVRPFTLRMLLGTTAGITAVVRFLKVTGIATRRWLRENEGEERGGGEERDSRREGNDGREGNGGRVRDEGESSEESRNDSWRWGWGQLER